MLLVSLISYIDRNTLALLAPTILRETGLSGEQYGFIISAFSIAYMLANPVWGRILDRAGLRRGMTVAVSCWTLASVAHAFAGGLWSFAAARSEEHTSELQSRLHLVCRLLLEKKKKRPIPSHSIRKKQKNDHTQ